jgi:hypothetical protein
MVPVQLLTAGEHLQVVGVDVLRAVAILIAHSLSAATFDLNGG